MPIVIDRKTGGILSKPNYTPEQIFAAQAVAVKNWAQDHKDLLASPEAMEEYLNRCKAEREARAKRGKKDRQA